MLTTGPVLASGPAGIKLDGTLGGSAAALAGPTYNITQNLGRLSGGNLFFSFQYFNVATGETALFSTTSAGINNLISRVTGGFGSTIDGTLSLQAAAGAPNFFLINPAGVTFTANAQVNVPAAFRVSTANYLKFADGNFYVDPTRMSTLSAAAPEAFGFLGTTRAPVNVQGATLAAAGGRGDFQIAAGDVTIDGGGGNAGLYSATGAIRVDAVGSAPSEVPLSGAFAATDGTLTIRNGGLLWSQGFGLTPGGTVTVNAGSLLIDGQFLPISSGIIAGSPGAPGPISVNIGNDARLIDSGSILSYNTYATAAAAIALDARSLTVDGGDVGGYTHIESLSLGTGAGADLTLGVAQQATIVSGGAIYAGAQAQGSGGNIALSSGALTLQATNPNINTVIEAYSTGSGNSGGVRVKTGSLTMSAPASNTAVPVNISSGAFSSGAAGNVVVNASGNVSLSGASGILSNTYSTGDGGSVSVQAQGTVSLLDSAQIATETFYGPGNGGNVEVSAGVLNIQGTAGKNTYIVTSTLTAGSGGAIDIQAGSMSIDGAGSNQGFTGIESTSDAAGAAGNVQIGVTGTASIANGGLIATAAYSHGSGGNIALTAGSLQMRDDGASSLVTGIYTSTYGAGNAGAMQIDASSLTMTGTASVAGNPVSIASGADTGSTGAAGDVSVNVSGNISLTGSAIASNTYAAGNGGRVNVTAGHVSLLGGGEITASTDGGTGNAGGVNLSAASLDIEGRGSGAETGVIASAGSEGNAGNIRIQVGTLSMDGGSGTGLADIDAFTDGSGAGGKIQVDVTGNATIADGASIFSDTYGRGNAGSISLSAGDLVLDTKGNTRIYTSIQANTHAVGDAGSIQIDATSLTLKSYASPFLPLSISSGAEDGSSGNAGNVTINVSGDISASGVASIASNSLSTGNAGRVSVSAGGNISLLDGSYISSIANGATGNAGAITVSGSRLDIEGQGSILTGISTESFGTGNSGNIQISVSSLMLDGHGGSGTAIDSEVFPTGTAGVGGAGGAIVVNVAGNAVLRDGSKISTTSFGSGPAGDVAVNAGTLSIGGGAFRSIISSGARAGSGGQPGNVKIDTGTLDILSDGSINISDNATVPDPAAINPTRIAITAGQIDMNDGLVTAASTGNVAASAIEIHYGSLLRMDPSTISTSAQDGNGGPISITGAGPLLMSHSNITTSVLGSSNGNGGNIDIQAPVMALDTGAIQANTFAPLASGGTVIIDAQALVPSFESYVLGGPAVTFSSAANGLNLVQAAAPDGVSGALNVTVPTLNLGSALLGLTGHPAAAVALGRGLCGVSAGSSLAVSGRGGVAPSASDPLWMDLEREWQEAALRPDYRVPASKNAANAVLLSCSRYDSWILPR